MSKILVTGAAGFIGSHLVERLLNDGHEVVGIDNFDPFYDRSIKSENLAFAKKNPNFYLIEGDILNIKDFQSNLRSIDLVIHLAAKAGVRPSIQDPLSYFKTNIDGTLQLLEWMQTQHIKKLIFASSSSVYGNNKTIPFHESHSVDHPISPYAASKKAGELICHTYHKLYSINCVCLRFFTVIGPRQRPDLAIHKFFNLIEMDKAISMFGDGTSARDYTVVFDTVDGIINAIDYVQENENCFEVLNLGNSAPLKLSELIKMIYQIANSEPNLIQLPMQPGDVDITYADISKAKELLAYDPSRSVYDGLLSFYEWYQQKTIKVGS